MTPGKPAQFRYAFLLDRAVLRRIAIVSAACTVLGIVYAFVAPRWYRSVTTVLPVKQQRSGGMSGILGADLAGIAAGLDSSLGGADTARIGAVLQSNVVSDAVIEKFDLRSRYGKKYPETARSELWRHCDVTVLAKPGLVQLSCEDKDPAFAQSMVGFFAEFGNQVFRRVGATSASEEVRFLEKRVAELRQQANDAGDRMREFQEARGIIDIDTQAKAVVSALAQVNQQKIAKQLELGYVRSFASGDEAGTRDLETQLSVMKQNLRELEEPGPAPDGKGAPGLAKRSGKLFPAALDVPKLRTEFERLFRDRKVAEATLIFALERLEGARANEARDTSTFLVLDPPSLPVKHSRPQRLVVVLLGALLGLVGVTSVEWIRGNGGPSSLLARLAKSP